MTWGVGEMGDGAAPRPWTLGRPIWIPAYAGMTAREGDGGDDGWGLTSAAHSLLPYTAHGAMERRCMKGRRGNPGLKGRLLEKSLQAYIIALETINKMSLAYRVEAAFMLICNAWELLLKAKILDDSRNKSAIYYPKERLKMKRTLSLTNCMNAVMPRQDDPIRRNLEKVIQLRDAAVHFEIKEWPYEVIGILDPP